MERIRKIQSMPKKKSAKLLAVPLIIWLLAFVIVPLVLVIGYGFTKETDDGSLVFSLENFKEFADPQYVEIFLRSLKIAFISTAICLAVGYPVAYIMSRSNPKTRALIIMLILMPMWMNFMLRTHAWLTILDDDGILNSILTSIGFGKLEIISTEGAVILGTVYDFLPFMIMPIYMVLIKLDNSLLEAAYDLGATPFQRFMRIVVPFSVPGVLSGVSMVFVPSVTTFAISQYFSRGKVKLIGDIIERQFGSANDWNFGAAISLVVMIIIILFMVAINKTDKGDIGEGRMIL